jgi:hypothetical protein
MIRSAVILLVIIVAVSIQSVSARNPQVLKDQYYAAIGIDGERGGRKLSSDKSGKGSKAKSAKDSKDGSMRLLLLVNEFGGSDNNMHRHEDKQPRMNIRRRGLDGSSKSGKGAKGSKGSKDGSMRMLLSEFGL